MSKIDMAELELTRDELAREVNRHFRIKLVGKNFVGPRFSKSVKYSGLEKIIGAVLAEKICRQAIDSPDDIFVRKLRRGLKIEFQSW